MSRLPSLHAIIDDCYTKDQLAKKAGKARCAGAKSKSDYVWAMLLYLGDTTDDKRMAGLLAAAKDRVRAEAGELATLAYAYAGVGHRAPGIEEGVARYRSDHWGQRLPREGRSRGRRL